MKLGAIIEWNFELAKFRNLIRLADELGYDYIGVGDTPARAWDVYVSLTIAAQETRNAVLAPMVTTPYLRHPAVTAHAISSLQTLTGGRMMLGVGAGGSAPRITGRPTGATLPELREYFLAVREVLARNSATFDGRVTEPLDRVRPVPLLLAADHPRTLRMAGELADGVIFTVGLSTDFVARKIAMIRDGALRAGRDPDSIALWGFSFVCVAGSRAEANREIGTALASDVGMRLTGSHMRALVPPELLGAVAEMERRYDRLDHVIKGKNAALVEELGLVDLAADLTAVTGTVDEVADHLKRLEALGLSAVFAATPALADPESTLRLLRLAA